MSGLELAPLALAAFVGLVWLLQSAVVIAALVELSRVRRRDRHQLWRRVLGSSLAPSISVLMPAYNEELSAVDSVTATLALSYPSLEIVVVNDGSPDRTLDVLVSHFGLYPVRVAYRQQLATAEVRGIYRSAREPRLVVVDKENGGKADALNVGLDVASGVLVCSIDADTLIANDALQHLVAPFLGSDDVVAAGGTVRLANGARLRGGRPTGARVPSRWLPGAQLVEYIRAFLIGRLGWNLLGGNLIVSGAFGLFDRARVLQVGGYAHGSLGEDMELVVRLRRAGYEAGRSSSVVFVPDPVAWTEAPESLRVLARQRNRWYRGLIDVLVRHRAMIGRRRYGWAGLVALPYFVLVELLSPIVEALGLVLIAVLLALGVIGPGALLVLLGSYLCGLAISLLVVLVDDAAFRSFPGPGQRLLIVRHAVAEHLVLRPLTVAWRLWGLALFLRGRTEWGEQVRRGFGTA